jgi:hypothetical protein
MASLALSACGGGSSTVDATGLTKMLGSNGAGQRDLSPQEKKAIVDAISPSLREASAAKYHWAKFPTVIPTGGTVNYCASVDAKSPYAAYSGHQDYIVETRVDGGQVTSAVIGLIAGGKDAVLVTKMCAKYGLDPKNAV